eukprot:2637334-Pleurochrysis_carterae.AAC.1
MFGFEFERPASSPKFSPTLSKAPLSRQGANDSLLQSGHSTRLFLSVLRPSSGPRFKITFRRFEAREERALMDLQLRSRAAGRIEAGCTGAVGARAHPKGRTDS